MYTFISDAQRKARGSWSRVYKITCKQCSTFLFHYQKDGPGELKRSYLDRIVHDKLTFDSKGYFSCPSCSSILGFKDVYAKENNRQVIRWAVDAVSKKSYESIFPLTCNPTPLSSTMNQSE